MRTNTDVEVILLTGPAGAGKSTVRDMINEIADTGQDYCPRKMAGKFKIMLKEGFNLTTEELEGALKEVPSDKLGGRTPRHAMQTLGSEWGRNLIHPNIWVMNEVRTIEHVYRNYPYCYRRFIYDDVRFENEIDLMREAFDTSVVRIVPTFKGYDAIQASGHASEQQELDWDYTLLNFGDLEELRLQVTDLMEGLL